MYKKTNKIFSFLKEEKKVIVISLIITVIYSFINVIIPIYIKDFMDGFFVEEIDTKSLNIIAISFILLAVFRYFLSLLKSVATNKMSFNISENIREKILTNIHIFDKEFLEKEGTGKINSIINTDISRINSFLITTFIPLFINLFTLLYIIINFLIKDFFIAILFLVYYIFSFVILFIAQSKKSDVLKTEREYEASLNQEISEIVNARKEIKIMGGLNYFLNKLSINMKKLLPHKKKTNIFLYRTWIISLILFSFSNIISLVIGSALYFNSIISIGYVYLIYSYSNLLREPLEKMQYYANNIFVIQKVITRLKSILNYKNKVVHGSEKINTNKLLIEVRNLNFKYGKNEVFKKISFSIHSGEKVAISGYSGVGKSTLIKILLKQVEVESNSVFISRVDLNKISLESIQNEFALFSSKNNIYDSSLIDNLTLFNKEISKEEVNEILKKTFFYEKLGFKIKLEKTLDINKLYEFQKELINLYRIFFINKSLIIIDEAISMINLKEKNNFFDLLNKYCSDKTFIIISHNKDVLSRCDKLIEFEDGYISYFGKIIGDNFEVINEK